MVGLMRSTAVTHARALTLVVALAASCVVVATPAEGAFPGSNGRIAYVMPEGDRTTVWTMRPGGTDRRQLTVNGYAADPAWSPDGTRIAFAHEAGTAWPELWVMNANGTGKRRLTNNTVEDSHPTWHRNGNLLVFSSRRSGKPQLHVYNLTTNRTRRVTSGDSFPSAPTWSPDGTRIAFVAFRAGASQPDLFSIKPDGTGLLALTNTAGEETDPAYAPGGGRIAYGYGHSDCGSSVWTIPAAGGTRAKVVDTPCNDLAPAWSPNGRRIALYSHGPGSVAEGIWTVNPNGTNLVNLTTDSGTSPDWQRLP